jgi:prepilin-type N-terminal cleavage/methylation domain-containing protein
MAEFAKAGARSADNKNIGTSEKTRSRPRDRNTMRSSRRHNRGFSILESLIAIVVLSIGVVAMLGMLPLSFNNTNNDSQHVQALSAGQAYMDQIRYYIKGTAPTNGAYPVSVLPTPQPVAVDLGESIFGTGQAASGSVNFTFVPNCAAVAGSALEFDCTVTVNWTTRNFAHSVQIESYVTTET